MHIALGRATDAYLKMWPQYSHPYVTNEEVSNVVLFYYKDAQD